MKSLGILILICVWLVCEAKWESPISIYKGEGEVHSHASVVDKASKTVHILFSVKKDDDHSLYYTNLKENGDIKTPLLLSNKVAKSGDFSPRLILGNDGKEIYLTMILARGDVGDIFFMESKDRGKTWSKLTRSRANNQDDKEERVAPSMVYVPTGRMFLFYKRLGGQIWFVSRSPGSKIWNYEKEVYPKKCSDLSKTLSISSGLDYYKKSKYSIFFSFVCETKDKKQHIIGETNNNGLTWEFIENGRFQPLENPGPILLSPIEHENYYGIMKNKPFNKNYEMTVMFRVHYTHWQEIMSLPFPKIDFHSVDTCVFGENPSVVYFVSPKSFTSNSQVATLLYIHQDPVWKLKNLPLPSLGETSSSVQVACFGVNKLFALGTVPTASGNELRGQLYTHQ